MSQTVTTSERSIGPVRTAWQLLRDAVRGKEDDYTTGSTKRAIVLLAVPMVLETCMESLFAVADVFFVSRLGADAVATVGLTESMLMIVYTVALALGMGATAVVARRIGEKDPEGAAGAAAQALLLGVGIALLIGVFGALNARWLLEGMGGTPGMVNGALGYTVVMLGGNATVTLLFLLNAIFRGAGDAAIAMRMLWIANAINLVLDPCLIFGLGPFPELGVAGAAIATNIGRGTAVVFQLWVLFSGRGRLHVAWRHLRVVPDVLWTVCRLTGPGFIQILLDTASFIGLVRVLSSFGSEALAGYTIGIRMVMFAMLPAWGVSNAAATMVGQALGAGKPERAEEAVWVAGRIGMWLLGSIGLVFIVGAPVIVSFFTTDPTIARHAVDCLRIVSCGFLFFAYGLVFTQAFNGAGDPWTPTWINFACFWVWQIPLAWVLAMHLGLGPRGVYIAITVAFSTLAVVSAVVFRRGTWKHRKV
jgi:putative MATE family efflux protein